MKPRIRSFGAGADGRTLWVCMGCVGIASGYSPAEAYEGWCLVVRAYTLRSFT